MNLGKQINRTISDSINGEMLRGKISHKIYSKTLNSICFMINNSLTGIIKKI